MRGVRAAEGTVPRDRYVLCFGFWMTRGGHVLGEAVGAIRHLVRPISSRGTCGGPVDCFLLTENELYRSACGTYEVQFASPIRPGYTRRRLSFAATVADVRDW